MIQPFATADLSRISHLQPDGWQNITAFFQFYLEAPFCLPVKIEDRNRIVAVGGLILHRETAWLAHIIVEPEIRRKGLAITEELITSAEKNGCNIQLLIATQMGVPLYEHSGFRRSCDYMSYHRPACRGGAMCHLKSGRWSRQTLRKFCPSIKVPPGKTGACFFPGMAIRVGFTGKGVTH